mgnify:CR=1 FL=1
MEKNKRLSKIEISIDKLLKEIEIKRKTDTGIDKKLSKNCGFDCDSCDYCFWDTLP